MSQVRARDTRPELIVRRIVKRLGYSFRTNHPFLPAKPDLVFPKRHKVIFVHGCFWHRHPRCRKASMPKTHVAFWTSKFRQNRLRDRATLRELQRRGWRTLVLWECETRAPESLRQRVRQYLEGS